jgi:hypothetical protein
MDFINIQQLRIYPSRAGAVWIWTSELIEGLVTKARKKSDFVDNGSNDFYYISAVHADQCISTEGPRPGTEPSSYKTNSVACSPQANYTDRATAACRQS